MTVRVSYHCRSCGKFIVENRQTARHPGNCPFCWKGVDLPEGV
ncbi:hypothetical protein [Halorientalis pallida]|nr:hypothetical protein [Halorientalis pallida]